MTDDSIIRSNVISPRVDPAVHSDEIRDETRDLTLQKSVIPTNHGLFENVNFVVEVDNCDKKMAPIQESRDEE